MLRVESLGEPILALVLAGRVVWAQYGLFGSIEVDKEALRRGIWIALEKWGLTPRRLGIRFDLFNA